MSDSIRVGGSLAQLAKLLNVNRDAVSKAARGGRLPRTGVKDPASGRFLGVTDLVAAAEEYRANTDLTKAPPARQAAELARDLALVAPDPDRAAVFDALGVDVDEEGGITLSNAAAQDKLWAAKKKQLEYLEAARELVPAADVERAVVDMITSCKTRLLAIPSRAKQALPHLTLNDLAVIEALVRETLEDLAEPSRAEVASA